MSVYQKQNPSCVQKFNFPNFARMLQTFYRFKFPFAVVQSVRQAHTETEEFDDRYEAYLNNPNIDSWQLRKAMNDLQVQSL